MVFERLAPYNVTLNAVVDDFIARHEARTRSITYKALVEAFIESMGKRKPGDEITLKVRRGDEELELKATLGKTPPDASRSDFQNKMGSDLSSRSECRFEL